MGQYFENGQLGRVNAKVQPQVAHTHASPVLDEATFQQILQAAYIIQEQNDRRREAPRALDPAATLAIIAETQELLHSRAYDVSAGAQLIAERLGKITHASGIAMAIVENDQLKYCAALGTCASLADSTGSIDAGLRDFFRQEALHPDQDRAELLNKNDNSPSFFPVYCDGRIAGVLQLSFPETESIQEHEIRSCQLMAGLMGETISRNAELEWKQSLAAERATMLEALERLRPQLERLAAEPAKEIAAETAAPGPSLAFPISISEAAAENPIPAIPVQALSSEPTSATGEVRPSSTCGNCGFQFSDGEMFCGRCGTPRALELPVPLGLPFEPTGEPTAEPDQTSLRIVEATHEDSPNTVSEMPVPAAQSTITPIASDVPMVEGSAALAVEQRPVEVETPQDEPETDLEVVTPAEELTTSSPWSSAVQTRKWLSSLKKTDSQWLAQHSGDISVVVAALVLMLVLTSWNTPVPKKAARNTPQPPSLTLFERMLVGLGLAEAPPTPVYSGNPNAEVWEDLHTGLYYCGGSELYGKTPGGKLTSQRDAQLDQFEPAARKTCD